MINKQTKELSLKAAYSFGVEHGLEKEVKKIKNMAITWDSSYTSSVKRGYIIELFKGKGVFEEFKTRNWIFANTLAGESKCRNYLKIKSRYDDYLAGRNFKRWNVISAVEAIKEKFSKTGSPTKIPMLKRGSFTAELRDNGVFVDNLKNESFLPWAAFQEAVCIMIQNDGRTSRGDAMGPKLGESRLPLDSIEGHVARVVYGKNIGDSVFRRITPIACILIWAGVCETAPNQLVLRGWSTNLKDLNAVVNTKNIEWSIVERKHVIEACMLYDAGCRLPRNPARSTFLLFQDKKYPAKFIRGLAYELATGQKLIPSEDYSGGQESANFLSKLGFEVEYHGKLFSQSSLKIPATQTSNHFKQVYRKTTFSLNPVSQKTAFKKLLMGKYGRVETEVKFDWLIVPDTFSMDNEISTIADNLTSYRDQIGFFTPGISLKCDFFIPAINCIIEYDERQHFTIPRDISLSLYTENLNLEFNIKKWREECKRIKAEDPNPPYRDEQRAFYDSLRDILSARHGYHLVRIKHGDYDWESKDASKALQNLLKYLN